MAGIDEVGTTATQNPTLGLDRNSGDFMELLDGAGPRQLLEQQPRQPHSFFQLAIQPRAYDATVDRNKQGDTIANVVTYDPRTRAESDTGRTLVDHRHRIMPQATYELFASKNGFGLNAAFDGTVITKERIDFDGHQLEVDADGNVKLDGKQRQAKAAYLNGQVKVFGGGSVMLVDTADGAEVVVKQESAGPEHYLSNEVIGFKLPSGLTGVVGRLIDNPDAADPAADQFEQFAAQFKVNSGLFGNPASGKQK